MKDGDSKSGLSGGASAGIAVVVIVLVLGLAGVAFFLWRKKKRAKAVAPDEKSGALGSTATATAVDMSEKGGASGTAPAAVPPGTSHSNVSPFDDRNVAATSPTPTSPFGDHAKAAAGTAAGVGAIAAASPAMSSSTRKAPPPALNLTQAAPPSNLPAVQNNRVSVQSLTPLAPPQPLKSPSASVRSDAYTDASNPGTPVVSTAASAIGVAAGTAIGITAGAAANAAANQGPVPPVHRVQMEFIPTMGDELELRVGQLVRVLHEYDDGWAQCVRLDRSEAGVCPRSCLSQRPVKPRPPPAGNRRAGPPIVVNTGRTSPNSGRPLSPPNQRAASPSTSFHSANEQVRDPVTVARRVSSGSTVSSMTPSTPNSSGYNKAAYRPNPERSASPAPQITISQPGDAASVSSDAASSTGATGGVTTHKPSPLSNLTSSSEVIPLETMPTGRQSPLARAPEPTGPTMSATITSVVEEDPFAGPTAPLPMPPVMPEILRPGSPVQRKAVGSGPSTPIRKEIPRKPVTPPALAAEGQVEVPAAAPTVVPAMNKEKEDVVAAPAPQGTIQ